MRSVFALLVMTLVCPLAMRADSITYTYTGPTFTDAASPYTTSDSISGSFTVAAPLAANLTTFTVITPVSFSFSDGVNTISDTSAGSSSSFQVETDAKGGITAYNIQVLDGTILTGAGGTGYRNGITFGNSYSSVFDDEYEYFYQVYYSIPYTYSCGWYGTCTGYNTGYYYSPGYLEVGYADSSGSGSLTAPPSADAPAITPEPASLVLVGTGLTSLAGCAWRRRRGGPAPRARNTSSC